MTAQIQRKAESLTQNVERYSKRVEKKLTKAGAKPDAAVVYSAAKYYPALEKLSKG